LDQSALNVKLEAVGFTPGVLQKVVQTLQSPFGIIFITGPTGSGKSTTVYSMLNYLNNVEKNIITVEDPVEYQFNMINQVQVQPKIGFTFATVLRSILRQDPDIIMVGEIRDKETAEIAIRAALTGHLVITTLHTNNAVATIARLMDMGIDSSLISGSLLGVVSQRLVRKLCPICRKAGPIGELDALRINSPRLTAETQIYHPTGCQACNNLGFRGRLPVLEFLPPDAEIRKSIVAGHSEAHINSYLKGVNFQTMREDGVGKILSGLTTPLEVLKATASDE
jgi:type II secretory ATPase GspE/PulE/Tfp pilus assembly ATPase PilB-like protein